MAIKTLNESSHLLLAKTLTELIERDKTISPASLARKLDIPTNKITRILNGDVTDPKASTLLQIANYFGIKIEQLLGLEPIVRQGEALENEQTARQLPVLNLSNPDYPKVPREWYRWVENGMDGNYYALIVDTDLYEPTFPQNSLLVINRDIQPEDRSYVVVSNQNNLSSCSIKQYVLEGNQAYLFPINPKLPIETYDKSLYSIVGEILEIHQKLSSKK